MSALLALESLVCPCGGDHLCACGCGEVLENVARAHALVASGATHKQAAHIMGVSREYVSLLHRKPPRFLKGHYRLSEDQYRRMRETFAMRRETYRRDLMDSVLRTTIATTALGDFRWLAYPDRISFIAMKTHAPEFFARAANERLRRRAVRADIAHLHWTSYFRQQQAEWARCDLWEEQFWNDWQEQSTREAHARCGEEIPAKDLVPATALHNWRRNHAARFDYSRELKRAIHQDRLERLWIKKATSDQAKILSRKATLERELRLRVEREDSKSWRTGALSLDAAIPGGDEDFYEVTGHDRLRTTHLVDEDPLAYVMRDRLWEIVDDADVTKLSEHEVARLRERLIAEGFTTPAVQRSERERLRDPDAHSGSTMRSQKSIPGSKTKRREKVANHRHSRPSQKPRKRWDRSQS